MIYYDTANRAYVVDLDEEHLYWGNIRGKGRPPHGTVGHLGVGDLSYARTLELLLDGLWISNEFWEWVPER